MPAAGLHTRAGAFCTVTARTPPKCGRCCLLGPCLSWTSQHLCCSFLMYFLASYVLNEDHIQNPLPWFSEGQPGPVQGCEGTGSTTQGPGKQISTPCEKKTYLKPPHTETSALWVMTLLSLEI